jgi:RNA polymerase sigma factor (sigma-70 family)
MISIDISDLYMLYYKRLFHISFSITRDIQLAEDVVQETFIKAMKKIETIEEISKVGAWLSAIATRTAIDFLRRERNKKAILMEKEMLESLGKAWKHNVEDEVVTGILEEQVHCAIRKLTMEYQDVLILKMSKGLKEIEIARILGLKLATVKTRIYRARKQLKILFHKQISADLHY